MLSSVVTDEQMAFKNPGTMDGHPSYRQFLVMA